jgi:glycine betaine/proline transport system ATP-binding protein
MQQRVGLARALTNNAPVLLMDEAFSALDPLIRTDMQTILLDLQKEIKKTIVFITHDLDEALRLGDRIAILRDGAVIQQGTGQDIVLRPADDYITRFVRHVNRGRVLLASTVMTRAANASAGDLEIPMDASLESALRIMRQADRREARVVDAKGNPVGRIDADSLVSAMLDGEDPDDAQRQTRSAG